MAQSRLGFAHSYLWRSFPPYNAAMIAGSVALVLAAIGLWMQPAPVAPVIPHPLPGPAAGPQSISGDYKQCGLAGSGQSRDAALTTIAACGRIIDGAANGTGTMTPANARIGRGIAELGIANDAAAVADFSNAIAGGATGYFNYYLRSVAQFGIGNFTAALDDANTALAERPGDANSLVAKSFAEVGLKDYQAAVAAATSALSSGENTVAHFVRGEAEALLADYPDALNDETADTNAAPSAWDGFYWKAVAEERIEGGIDNAISDLNTSLRIDPQYAPSYAEMGLIAFKQQRLADAESNETKAISLFSSQTYMTDPNYPRAHALAFNTRSAAEIKQMQYAAAAQDAAAALALGPAGPLRASVLKNLGLAQYDLGDYADAANAFSQALAIDPGDASLSRLLEEARGEGAKR